MNPEGKPWCARSDPRMNRALAARLENQDMTLYQCLLVGGFDFASDDATAVDSENVTLSQRKNQLNRRLRSFKSRREKVLAAKAAAAAVRIKEDGVSPSALAAGRTPVLHLPEAPLQMRPVQTRTRTSSSEASVSSLRSVPPQSMTILPFKSEQQQLPKRTKPPQMMMHQGTQGFAYMNSLHNSVTVDGPHPVDPTLISSQVQGGSGTQVGPASSISDMLAALSTPKNRQQPRQQKILQDQFQQPPPQPHAKPSVPPASGTGSFPQDPHTTVTAADTDLINVPTITDPSFLSWLQAQSSSSSSSSLLTDQEPAATFPKPLPTGMDHDPGLHQALSSAPTPMITQPSSLASSVATVPRFPPPPSSSFSNSDSSSSSSNCVGMFSNRMSSSPLIPQQGLHQQQCQAATAGTTNTTSSVDPRQDMAMKLFQEQVLTLQQHETLPNSGQQQLQLQQLSSSLSSPPSASTSCFATTPTPSKDGGAMPTCSSSILQNILAVSGSVVPPPLSSGATTTLTAMLPVQPRLSSSSSSSQPPPSSNLHQASSLGLRPPLPHQQAPSRMSTTTDPRQDRALALFQQQVATLYDRCLEAAGYGPEERLPGSPLYRTFVTLASRGEFDRVERETTTTPPPPPSCTS